MSFWNSLLSWLSTINTTPVDDSIAPPINNGPGCAVNPATGLPMMSGDCTGLDVAGNPYGANLHDDWTSHRTFDDPW